MLVMPSRCWEHRGNCEAKWNVYLRETRSNRSIRGAGWLRKTVDTCARRYRILGVLADLEYKLSGDVGNLRLYFVVSELNVDCTQLVDIILRAEVQTMDLPVNLSCKRYLAAAGAG